ncbi:hypothetical protein ACF0H5_018964 [Mactra antiquata]
MNSSVRRILCAAIISTILSSLSHCQTINNASDLIDDLLTNYKTVLRPVINQTEAVIVNVSMELLSIIEFDEVKGNLHMNGFLTVAWTDQRLTWDPSDYDGISSIMIESSKVWTPLIVLTNTIKKTEKIGSDDPWLLIRYLPTGNAQYFPGGLLSSSCTADVTYYPFDSHSCYIQFTSWATPSYEMQLNPVTNGVSTNVFTPNGIWTLKSSYTLTAYENAAIYIYLTLERQSRFIVFNVILPIVFMTILNTLVFLIPIDSGERISYNITMLLAVAVFLTLVGDNLPKTSSPMSIFSYYLVAVLTLSVLFAIANIISIRCYFASDDKNINSLWKRLVNASSFNIFLWCKTKTKIHTNVELENENSQEHLFIVKQQEKSNHQGKSDVEKETQITNDNATNGWLVSWKDVSHAVDRISFMASVLLTSLTTMIFLVVIYTGSKA